MAAPAAAQTTPLFASDDPIHIKIAGPVNAVARGAEGFDRAPRSYSQSCRHCRNISDPTVRTGHHSPAEADLQLPATQGRLCPKASGVLAVRRAGPFEAVTHCQNDTGFQQHLLLEYSAYRIFNLISP
jgi:hypothetical protein